MTVEENFGQARSLGKKIRHHREEIERTRELACSISSPCFEESFNPNNPTDAAFQKRLEELWERERELRRELILFLQLEAEITGVINSLPDTNERFVLTCRYLKDYKWNQIADVFSVERHTVRRWHDRALEHIVLPEKPTKI